MIYKDKNLSASIRYKVLISFHKLDVLNMVQKYVNEIKRSHSLYFNSFYSFLDEIVVVHMDGMCRMNNRAAQKQIHL